MGEFKRKAIKFDCRGIQISRPVDALDENYYLKLTNVRSFQDGSLRQRGGYVALTSVAADNPVHSIRVLNDDVTGASQAKAAILGIGTKVYTSNAALTTLTSKDSGYSGKFLSFVPHRPNQSPEPWMYIGDSSRLRKINVAGTNYPIGISAPNAPISATLGGPIRKIINDFDTAGDWTQGGTAGAPAATANNRVNTTIAAILYDTGTTGWALIKPTSMTQDIQSGLRLTFGAAAETAVIEDVFNPITDSTIGSITYDSGTSGLCTIQLAAPAPTGIILNMMLYNSTQTEYIRVLGITTGPDGSVSFRCSTSATFAATNTIQGVSSFRVYLTGTRAAADALKATYLTSNVTAGIGYLTATSALDLTVSASNGRSFSEEDEIHISVRVSNLTSFTEGRIELDVDSVTNDFTKNYYYYPFRANDLTPAVASITTSLTAEQIIQQRQLITADRLNFKQSIDPFGRDASYIEGLVPDELLNANVITSLPPGQTTTGTSQWTELKFKRKDLIRVGSDTSRSLKNIATLRVQVNLTGTVDLDLDSWWIGGSYGPDSLDFPINYRYRARSSTTGALSNACPPMRSAVEPHRESVIVTLATHSDSQVDKLDVFRIGGTLLDYTYVGTVDNGTGTFTDSYIDAELLSNPLLEYDNWQPFPLLDTPRTGICNVSGTKVTRTGGTDSFNTSWSPGSIIIIDGIVYTLYASPTSSTLLEINENAGTKSSVTFSVPSATLLGQPLPIIFGPYGGGSTGVFMFGLGAGQQPSTLFWTKGNNPDSAPTANQLEITSPSEPLMTGCMYNGRAYAFSSDRMFEINPNFGGVSDFIAQEVPNARGCYSRWGVAVGEKIYFLARDGIYETSGSIPTSITDKTLYNLFAHEAGTGTIISSEIQGITLPDWSDPDSMKLSYHAGFLYFTYQDSSNVWATLVYDIKREAWFNESASPTIVAHYGVEGKSLIFLGGGSDGKLYNVTSSSSDGNGVFTSTILTGFNGMEDTRGQKLFRDILLDINTVSGGTVTVKVYKDGDLNTILQTFTITPNTLRSSPLILDLNSGAGYLARNIALEISWNTSDVRLFEWHPSWISKNEKIESRFTDWTDAGIPGDKRVMGFLLDADTFNVAKSIQLQYDGGTLGETYTITHNGQKRIAYAITSPFNAKLLRISPQDEIPWYLENIEWITESVPELLPLKPDFDTDGPPVCKWLQGFELEADTGNLPISLTIQGDSGTILETFTATHNGRVVIPYSFTPDVDGQLPITHAMKIVPSGNIRVWNVRWIWVPEAELAKNWITPPMVLEPGRDVMNTLGFYHLRDCYIGHRSTVDITLVVNVDGTDHSMILPNSGGDYQKSYLVFPPLKGKAFQFRLTSPTAFRLYSDDTEVRAKTWGSKDYQVFHPFGKDRPLEHGHTAAEI